ncbi:hypothetical protein [Halioxenophilus aromaticivorans]|uniref:DUF983 domain-containing protein n=1 Tax=Halioxenophilus aromaticivorans TaxID=1306992 RepID=A0AAV3TWS6_9ALTE
MNPKLVCPNCKNSFKLEQGQGVISLNRTREHKKVNIVATTCPYCNLALSVHWEWLAAVVIIGGFLLSIWASLASNSLLPLAGGFALVLLHNVVAARIMRVKSVHNF